MSSPPISTLPGIGPVSQKRLEEAGIATIGDLQSLGAVEAYRRLKFLFPQEVTLNALYGLEAALRGCHWLDLPTSVKTVLQQEAKAINEALRRGLSSRCRLD
ncbi:TfoX/Sxy family DNA transformation protein [Microvirga rosea]|uniref:TfoX/Sxy family DNA transformation protein n=1 Tax=Microvirga rosea TaxID=2715425 RepID=UPI001D0A3296|nr:TfoX/Sxy family DNA transformation protein [Microvirga rosea]MCB8822460.1 TfoX/Sxy family protein [Microvirga rosea]